MKHFSRRDFAKSIIALGAMTRSGDGRAALIMGPPPPFAIGGVGPLVSPEIMISYGQSWRSNGWSQLIGPSSDPPGLNFNLSPQAENLVPMFVTNSGAGNNFAPGPMPNSAGISLSGLPVGLTAYSKTDSITIGRCAVLARQIMRAQNGLPANPIIEFCCAFPSSSWLVNGGNGQGLQPGGTPWTNQLAIIAALNPLFPLKTQSRNFGIPKYTTVGYTQGYALQSNTIAAKVSDLNAMMVAYDALGLLGSGLIKLYLEFPPEDATYANIHVGNLGNLAFSQTNAPGAGGTYSGRVFGCNPMYPYRFAAFQTIHTGDYGTARTGEFEGLVQYITQDLGNLTWNPLWVSRVNPITVSGQVITVPFDVPSVLSWGGLQFFTNNFEGPVAMPNQGFQVMYQGSPLTITNVAIVGNTVQLTVSGLTLTSGTALEVSYAYYGSIFSAPAPYPSVQGNLMCASNFASPLFPDRPMYAWAWPFLTNITV